MSLKPVTNKTTQSKKTTPSKETNQTMISMITSKSPHIKNSLTSSQIMMWVFIALLPAAIAGIYFFGISAAVVIFSSLLAAFISDIAVQVIILHHQKNPEDVNLGDSHGKNSDADRLKKSTFKEKILSKFGSIENFQRLQWLNWSTLVTGLLLAMCLPPKTSPWITMIGAVVAIVIGKAVFGKGNNIFNPALVGRMFIAISFPALMAGWVIPDGITSATPLTVLKESSALATSVVGSNSASTAAFSGTFPGSLGQTTSIGFQKLVIDFGSEPALYKSLFLGNIGGCIGEVSALALLLGGLGLIIFGIVNWRIPTAFLTTVAVISALSGRSIMFDILSGGILLAAFFMATDYVTSPITANGRLIFGIGCGLLTMIFRMFSTMPEGAGFSILLMNGLVPLIERYTKPKPFGRSRRTKVLKNKYTVK